jgi:signal transduction histidine kinase
MVRTIDTERPRLFVSTRSVGAIIWLLLGSIFLFDIWTHPENVSACFAYAIPILVSLFELKPRPFLYAGAATALSVAGSFALPSSELPLAAVLANRFIAVVTQWMVALLVKVQYRRQVDMQQQAEYQRRFVAILSHEIGTALTTITGQAYRLAKLSERISPSDLKARAEKIRSAGERIEEIVGRIQFASSLGDGTIPVERRTIDVALLLTKLLDQLKEDQRYGPIELHVSSKLPIVEGDEMLLHQLFENVVMNSAKYSCSPNASISVEVVNRSGAVRVAIVDRGGGIGPDELPRIREPYFRGKSSKGTSGAGLGLYFVERIVEAHGGQLLLESDVGKGTRVIIDLPKSRDAKP